LPVILLTTVATIYDGVNELRGCVIPLLASPPQSASAVARSLKRRRVAASSRKCCAATEADTAGREAGAR